MHGGGWKAACSHVVSTQRKLSRSAPGHRVYDARPGAYRVVTAPSEQVLDRDPAAAGGDGTGAGAGLASRGRRVAVRRDVDVDHGGRRSERHVPVERDDDVRGRLEPDGHAKPDGPGRVEAVGEPGVAPGDPHGRDHGAGAVGEPRGRRVLEGRREASPEDEAESLGTAHPGLRVEDEEALTRGRERRAHLVRERTDRVGVRTAVGGQREEPAADAVLDAPTEHGLHGGVGPLGRGVGLVGAGGVVRLALLEHHDAFGEVAKVPPRLPLLNPEDLDAPLDVREAVLDRGEALVERTDVGGVHVVRGVTKLGALGEGDPGVRALLVARAVRERLQDEVEGVALAHRAAVVPAGVHEHRAGGTRAAGGDAAAGDLGGPHLADRRGGRPRDQDVEVDRLARRGRPHERLVVAADVQRARAAEPLELVGLGGREAPGTGTHRGDVAVEGALAGPRRRVLREGGGRGGEDGDENGDERGVPEGLHDSVAFSPNAVGGSSDSYPIWVNRTGGFESPWTVRPLSPKRVPLPTWHRSSSRLGARFSKEEDAGTISKRLEYPCICH